MPESGTFGSVRGVPGDGHPYRNPRPFAVDHEWQLCGGSTELTSRAPRLCGGVEEDESSNPVHVRLLGPVRVV